MGKSNRNLWVDAILTDNIGYIYPWIWFSVVKGSCETIPEFQKNSDHDVLPTTILNNVCNDVLIKDQSWHQFQNLPRPEQSFIQKIQIDVNIDGTSFVKRNAFAYVCGWLYLKLYKYHNCLSPLPYFGHELVSDDFLFKEAM